LVVTHGSLSQAEFLNKMGIEVRVEALKKSASGEDRKTEIDKAAKRLVDLNGMGKQYRVLGVSSSEDPAEVWPFVEI